MGMFETIKHLPYVLDDLTPVAEATMNHFKEQGFEVAGEKTLTNGWDLSLAKGKWFKAVFGLKSALKISIEPSGNVTIVKASVGLFGTQAIPTMIALFITWPVLLTQIWGMVKQSKLDDEAIDFIEASLQAHAKTQAGGKFCPSCGMVLPSTNTKFCAGCGTKLGG